MAAAVGPVMSSPQRLADLKRQRTEIKASLSEVSKKIRKEQKRYAKRRALAARCLSEDRAPTVTNAGAVPRSEVS